MPSSDERLTSYLAQLDRLEGWMYPTTGLLMGEVLRWQSAQGVSGGIAEIGVHHGKSFIALGLAAEAHDALIAIDCFEDQAANVDFSGYGDRAAFEANLANWMPERAVRIETLDSLTLRGQEAAYGLADLRFFSVDGSHTREATLNDLQVADTALGPDGVCALDDLLNHHWLGVITGLFDYLNGPHGLVPAVLVPNKLFMARPDKAMALREALFARHGSYCSKRDVLISQYPVDIYEEAWQPPSVASAEAPEPAQAPDLAPAPTPEPTPEPEPEPSQEPRDAPSPEPPAAAHPTGLIGRITAPFRR
ncbi:MAG: class I SAM-dependent methyltransferase [Pseudomonadota bacterium]